MKKDVLIVYNIMGIGGSTTSLLSLLNYIDTDKYNIDFALANNEGELLDQIPNTVNILPELCPRNIKELKLKSVRSLIRYLQAKTLASHSKNPRNVMGQLMTYENARFSREIKKKYDVAISFLENYPLNYVATKVTADKKIAWIHVDYKAAAFIPKYDIKYYNKFNKVVLVSNECKKSFDECFPELAKKSVVIENLLNSKTVRKMADSDEGELLEVDSNKINLVTVCRITFSHKGLDRGVYALKKLKEEGRIEKFHWYIIGDGLDYTKLKNMIVEYDLGDNITLLGSKINPLAYEKKMDLFFLPSRYEGKPMAVTEAQMLGIPPVVTAYASAVNQIESGINGYIVPNEDKAAYDALSYIEKNPEIVETWKRNVKKEDFSNISEIQKIYDIIEE